MLHISAFLIITIISGYNCYWTFDCLHNKDCLIIEMDQGRHHRMSPRTILQRIGFEFNNNFKLGSGRYSKVYKGLYTNANRHFAIKVIDLHQISSDFKEKFLPREIDIWRQLDHRNHVYLYKDFEKDDYQFSIMELASGGDMLNYVQNNGPVAENTCREWMLQLIDALAYLHGKKVAHRDLKLENILLFDGGILKIADYGFCKQCKESDLASTFCGSKSYSAPQILRGIPYDIFKSDIWSLGVIGYIMLTNTMPFREDVDNGTIVQNQRNRHYHYSSKLGLSHDSRYSIDKMMTFDEVQRPDIFQCRNLSWFSLSTSTNGTPSKRKSRRSGNVCAQG